MFELFETLAVIDGVVQNPHYHQARCQQALTALYGSTCTPCDFTHLIIPNAFQSGLVRARVDYNTTDFAVQFFPYQRRNFLRFKPVVCDEINYAFKFVDRTLLNALYAQRGECDEVIIIKQGLVTDCSIGNLCFLKQGVWYTPKTPLLAGTQRAKLLDEGRIVTTDIRADQWANFEQIRVINALNPL
ncbi:hypothetical protein HPC38_03890 [Pasteurellaceae bacterium HPA106]|uniref:aminotransferase class IV family protein n=1 Tax=Spirabiliibacterium pneumoniae TaxID=221400 RepID=UPI001AAC8101|nr:aminotransferase class IV family protein [Spirabiliibacterium pneumoniae]MBE2896014.1 hypothetical protein [Spirabiliibacterium pneumoniae]